VITDNVLDLVSDKNKRIILEADAPVLHIDEIKAILVGVLNAQPQFITTIPYLIEVFSEFIYFKKGNKHEVVLTGTRILDSVLQEHNQLQAVNDYRQK